MLDLRISVYRSDDLDDLQVRQRGDKINPRLLKSLHDDLSGLFAVHSILPQDRRFSDWSLCSALARLQLSTAPPVALSTLQSPPVPQTGPAVLAAERQAI